MTQHPNEHRVYLMATGVLAWNAATLQCALGEATAGTVIVLGPGYELEEWLVLRAPSPGITIRGAYSWELAAIRQEGR